MSSDVNVQDSDWSTQNVVSRLVTFPGNTDEDVLGDKLGHWLWKVEIHVGVSAVGEPTWSGSVAGQTSTDQLARALVRTEENQRI